MDWTVPHPGWDTLYLIKHVFKNSGPENKAVILHFCFEENYVQRNETITSNEAKGFTHVFKFSTGGVPWLR
jgi:hypothetical protein